MPRALLVLCWVALSVGALAVPTAGAGESPTYLPPVDAEVIDAFRPPSSPYGPGNRGLEYSTAAGTEVVAAAAGIVTFAGPVAGTLHVTVLHADGVRTSYSFLARVDVVRGQHVEQGDVVGLAGGRLHLGARVGDAYFDPALLFETGLPAVHLVPFDEPPGEGLLGERSALSQLIGGIGGLVGAGLDVAGGAAGWLRDQAGDLVSIAAYYAVELSPTMLVLESWAAWQTAWAVAHRDCTRPDSVVGKAGRRQRRIAVLVGGLGSTSESAAVDDIDTHVLGYAEPDVMRFSYGGGRTPDDTDGFPEIPATSYGPEESQTDLWTEGALLADLLEQVAVAAQGAPIDIYAHSQGGLVTRAALIELERRHGVAWLDRLGLVATLGSPHGGADLATAVDAIGTTAAGSALLDAVGGLTDQALDDDSASVRQLSERSTFVAALAEHPVPANVSAVSIAARGDVVVSVPRAAAPGMTEVVVPLMGASAHDELPGSPLATRELELALAGLPPGCQGFMSALADQASGLVIGHGEDLVGAAGLIAVWP